ncbi:MAG: membrane protein insertase YidC, partial [Rhodospirillales bacterium]|nr:membrane protein insertase YidC [Rhodospirillales bacterium]
LTKPIFMALMYFNGFLGNMGFSILLLTVLIKLAFFPLANKSYRAMSKMKQLQPEMMKLRERFAEDKARLNQEIMGMYKREKANPAAGCLPILPQIPVFFALYKVVFVTIELRHAPFVGWIHDLSAPDPVTLLTGFGLFTWNVPEILHIANIGVWPIIMGITMFAQQKLNPPPPDPMQAKIFMFLPLIFTFMLAGFPAGLVIYWAWNNFLSVAQQYVIMRRAGVPIGGGKAKPKAPKKS